MTPLARTICGIILLTVPTIQYGGYFLLVTLTDTGISYTPFQRAMFRAGHAHAGVLVVLALVAQLLADHANLPRGVMMIMRLGFPIAAILVSSGFFFGAMGQQINEPTAFINLLYMGILVLATSAIILGIGLLRKQPPHQSS